MSAHKSDNIVIGLGGGCHWCTEAVFASIKGINQIQQGWLMTEPPADTFSEGILIEFDNEIISLEDIITIHIETHSASSQHSMREKYRSAIYIKQDSLKKKIKIILKRVQSQYNYTLITQILSLTDFKPQDKEEYIDYYYKNPKKPFCQTHISSKLKHLLVHHKKLISKIKLDFLEKN
ncbi:MAG: peptide-methionine (S)-S-oxide reductase [Gammaproteobacteria bacterium]|nr:peptide-methionine (S)-S-oxide reductase [Gammaproteobacteria bacterium]